MDIVGLGTVAMDVILRVDALPQEDGFAVIQHQSYAAGGSAANVMVQAGRLGAECGFIAQIGADEIGAEIKKSLVGENIRTEFMPVKKKGVSLHTMIVVGVDGRKFILLNMGDAFLAMERSAVNLDFIKSAGIFYTDLLPGEPAIYALAEAKKAGLKTVFNLQTGVSLMEQFGVGKAAILDALRYVDVFAPCREAFAQLTETADYAAGLQSFQKYFQGTLLLTRGGEGSVASSDGRVVEVPVHRVTVTDTTGAGDSYIGAFMYAYFLRGLPLEKAMRVASVCAGMTCTGLGARTSPYLQQVENYCG